MTAFTVHTHTQLPACLSACLSDIHNLLCLSDIHTQLPSTVGNVLPRGQRAAANTGGTLHGDPCPPPPHTHTHMYTHVHTCTHILHHHTCTCSTAWLLRQDSLWRRPLTMCCPEDNEQRLTQDERRTHGTLLDRRRSFSSRRSSCMRLRSPRVRCSWLRR